MKRILFLALTSIVLVGGGCAHVRPAAPVASVVAPPPPGAYSFLPPAPRGTHDVGTAGARAAKNPLSAGAACDLGLACYKARDYGRAAKELRRAIWLAPRSVSPDAYDYLSYSWQALHYSGAARDVFAGIVRLPTGSRVRSKAYFDLGSAESQLGRADAAAADFNESIRLDPGNSSALWALGLIAMEAGRVQEARSLFVRSARASKSLYGAAVAHGALAETYEALGILPAARRHSAIAQELMARALREAQKGNGTPMTPPARAPALGLSGRRRRPEMGGASYIVAVRGRYARLSRGRSEVRAA